MKNNDDATTLQFEFSRPWVAKNNEELFRLLKEEAQIWDRFELVQEGISLGYKTIFVDIDQFDEYDEETFSPEQIRDFLPPSSSPTGSLFLDALRTNNSERFHSLVYAFFVSNSWVESPFEIPNTINGSNFRYRESFSKYLEGLSLLGGAIGSSEGSTLDGVAISSDDVKKRLGILKADISRKRKLLQTSLANARQEVAKLREDRSQIRSIAASGNRIANARFKNDRNRWNSNFSDVYDQYTKQLEYKASVELWGERAEKHRTDAKITQSWLIGLGALFALCIIVAVVVLGDDIAASFVRSSCSDGNNCVDVWSAKGPLTIGSVLLVASLVLWLLRTLNKFYLSSRHLASDAEERKAFVQTYLALREDQSVDAKHEAIVLAALFRPTQDGVVTDEAQPIDPSLVSVLSRRISG